MFFSPFQCFVFPLTPASLRSLDADLGALAKAAEPFEWERISFILEALVLQKGSSKYIINIGNIMIVHDSSMIVQLPYRQYYFQIILDNIGPEISLSRVRHVYRSFRK